MSSLMLILHFRSVLRETLPVGKQHVWSIFIKIQMWRYADSISSKILAVSFVLMHVNLIYFFLILFD